jgi:hypothetical protein
MMTQHSRIAGFETALREKISLQSAGTGSMTSSEPP